jgi:hypothetical protein
MPMSYVCSPKRESAFAQMAESVDAMVSNTIVCKDMPVRVRLWVQPGLLMTCHWKSRFFVEMTQLPELHFRLTTVQFCTNGP